MSITKVPKKPPKKLTESNLASLALPTNARRFKIYFDKGKESVTGLGVKVMKSGRRTFILRYSDDGKRHEKRIGDVAGMTLATARKKAREKREAILNGERIYDPITLGELITAYLEANQTMTARSRENYEYARDKYLGDLKDKVCLDLKPSKVVERLNYIFKEEPGPKGKKGKRAKALATARTIRAAWKWGYEEYGLPEKCPTDKWDWPSPPKRKLKPQIIDRLPEIWEKIETLSEPRRALWKALFLTGARPGSLLSLKWSDVDLKKKTMLFREAKGDDEEEYAVPLGLYLTNALTELHAEGLEGEYVFPANNKDGFVASIKQPSLSLSQGDKKKNLPVAPVDARKTYQTIGSMKVPGHSVRLLVNHALPANDIASSYVQFHTETLRSSQELIEQEILKAAGVDPITDV